MNPLSWLDSDEPRRLEMFPVARKLVFLGHAGVTALPKAAADAILDYTQKASVDQQEYAQVLRDIRATREAAAKLIGSSPEEVVLLGPTSLGLSMVAGGLTWKPGDEVICYLDDYPANVYPWMVLERLGVKIRFLNPERLGEVTPELVAAQMSPRTKLLALASCNFLSGYRIEIEAMGNIAHENGSLFCLDAIQTLGAFPTRIDKVDFLSADAHKWLLGPMAIGVVFVRKSRFEELRPILIGAANVRAPNYIAQDTVQLRSGAERYEPGVLNILGVMGMKAGIELILEAGIEAIGERILQLKAQLLAGLKPLGFSTLGPETGPNASGIATVSHPSLPAAAFFEALKTDQILASHRFDRAGKEYIRFSPHFYNTFAEMDLVIACAKRLVG